METEQILQISVTVAAILGAVAIGFVCDLLQTNNERLGQLNLELRIRNKIERGRAELALDQLRRIAQASAGRCVAYSEGPALDSHAPDQEPSKGALRAGNTLDQARAMARQILATSGTTVKPIHKTRGELIPFESLHANYEVPKSPSGLSDHVELNSGGGSQSAIRGTVIAIGVNGLAHTRSGGADQLLEVVTGYLRSLLKPGEFAWQTSADQFVIVSPELDDAAQRRFDELAGKLCDSELRHPATNCNLFNCGGYEARGETFSEAVGIAAENMRNSRELRSNPVLETTRHRKVM